MKITDGKGNFKAFQFIKNSHKITREGIRKAFYYIGNDLRRTTQESILSGPKTGRTYLIRIGGRKINHTASAPGEAPANFTGNLRKSIGFEVRGGDKLEFGSRSGPPAAGLSPKQSVAEYSKYLELGTSKMAARPYLKPSITKNQQNAKQHFEREIERGFKS